MKVTYAPEDLVRAYDLATRISPTAKGGAWDKAAGMVMDIEADGRTTVLSTNIDTAVHIVITATAITDPPEGKVRWRMSSLFLAPFVKKLHGPIVVTEDTKKNVLVFKSGKSKVQVPLMDPEGYPEFHQPPSTVPVDGANLVAMADRIMWACDQNPSSGSPLSGLHADGTNIVACRHEGLSMLAVPLEVAAITFQARELIGLLKGYPDIRISADDTKVFLWVNDTDWVSASLIVAPYPKYGALLRADHLGTIVVPKAALMECLDRLSIVAAQDRGDLPKVTLTITEKLLHMKMLVKDVGDCEESVPITDGPGEAFTVSFSLAFLLDAVRNVDGLRFNFSYGPEDRQSCMLTDETGWQSILMPRR